MSAATDRESRGILLALTAVLLGWWLFGARLAMLLLLGSILVLIGARLGRQARWLLDCWGELPLLCRVGITHVAAMALLLLVLSLVQ